MELNADFTQRIVMHADELEWLDSPMPGVQRKMLDRIGGEVARATSIVRYAPGSHFSPHVHTGGEEFIVLEGVFQDEHGDFPAGSYIRNPPQSKHTPGSESGCVIFVKLWQFDLQDRCQVRTGMTELDPQPDPTRPGVSITPLHRDSREDVRLEYWAPQTQVEMLVAGGAEILVLEGSIIDNGDTLQPWSWLRLPLDGNLNAQAGPKGARVWVKTGHLHFVTPPQQQ